MAAVHKMRALNYNFQALLMSVPLQLVAGRYVLYFSDLVDRSGSSSVGGTVESVIRRLLNNMSHMEESMEVHVAVNGVY
jgi:hypothetical protein